jgi:regulator of protease activity HflC (stomatin/prohibitin superfamily)
MTNTSAPLLKSSREHTASTSSGYLMLAVLLGVAALGIYFGFFHPRGGLWIFSLVICALAVLLIAKGFYVLQPNQAAAILLFGSYRGSDRTTGLRWVWPWMNSEKVSVRANNIISDRIKVNDLRGNPIEMAAQVVWRSPTPRRRYLTSMTTSRLSTSRSKRRCASSDHAIPTTISSTRK